MTLSQAYQATAFCQTMQAFDAEQKQEMALAIVASFDSRLVYEQAKIDASGSADTILAKLKKISEKLALPSRAAVLLAANTSSDFINRHERSTARYNVYAADKLQDIVQALADGRPVFNAINNAIIRSMLAFDAAGVEFTIEAAHCACVKSMPSPVAAWRKLLVRHTISTSAMSTQTSSTTNALLSLGIVDEYRAADGKTAWRFTASDITQALRVAMAPAVEALPAE